MLTKSIIHLFFHGIKININYKGFDKDEIGFVELIIMKKI